MWTACCGALIAPTDPIAVLAMVKKMNLSSITETRIAGSLYLMTELV